MAFSRITITFNEELVDGDTTEFDSTNPTITFNNNCVLGRTSSYEFDQATPTATVGEATAINYTDSFIRDYGDVLYDITQALNVVTITARNEVQVFSGGASNKNVGFVISSVATIPFKETLRINARSPYYLFAPLDTGNQLIIPTNVVFNLYVWSGDKTSDKPTEPNYVYQKKSRFLNDNVIYIDVSNEILDFINQSYSGALVNSSVFVSWEITSTYSSGSIVSNNTLLAFDGYNSHFDGVNYNPIDGYMLTNRYVSLKSGESLILPFFDGKYNYTIEARDNTTVLDSDNVVAKNIQETSLAVFNVNFNEADMNNVRVLNTDTTDEFVIDVEQVEECIYNPIKCVFVNKQGVLQEFWFFKASKEDLTVKDETYNKNVLTESINSGVASLSYNVTDNLTQRFNVQGKTNITLNTGYVDEDNNEIIKEMLLSKNIWLHIGSVIKAVNIKDKSVSYLTKRNDQLIKYTLKFEFSYDEIQNIR